jgi:hypothetical protein
MVIPLKLYNSRNKLIYAAFSYDMSLKLSSLVGQNILQASKYTSM